MQLQKTIFCINAERYIPYFLIEINLENQSISISNTSESETFEMDPYKKICLINGYDDIDFLLSQKDIISKFEEKRYFSFNPLK